MYIAACYLRLASCGSPLENAGLLVIVIADDAKDGNPCSKGCHESLVTSKGSASHHFELQPGQLRNSLLAEKEQDETHDFKQRTSLCRKPFERPKRAKSWRHPVARVATVATTVVFSTSSLAVLGASTVPHGRCSKRDRPILNDAPVQRKH